MNNIHKIIPNENNFFFARKKMEIEYERWSMVQFILHKNTNNIKDKKQEYEMKNILERFFMLITNNQITQPNYSDVFPAEISNREIQVIKSELIEKKIQTIFCGKCDH